MRSARGFSLLEVLVATTLLTVSLAALAQLFAIATRANRSARATTYSTLLAQQKIEQLRSLAWGFDALGLPLSDTSTDITVEPERETGGNGLRASPANTLGQNIEGYVEYLDTSGRVVGGGPTPPDGTVYIRRWSVEPLPTNPSNTIVIQVLVTRHRARGTADTATGARRLQDEARLITVKTRKPS
jgi:prepilin-type N-terminal cleavage/methylation domain-containing protein